MPRRLVNVLDTHEARHVIDGDILIGFHKADHTDTFLLAAQSIQGATETAQALRASGHIVTVRVWNGKAYSEERL